MSTRSRTGASGEFGIGQRVLDDGGFAATVRYIGPVASSKSADSTVIWVGVEFDDPNRGKHSTGAIEHPITGIQARNLFCTLHFVTQRYDIVISSFLSCDVIYHLKYST